MASDLVGFFPLVCTCFLVYHTIMDYQLRRELIIGGVCIAVVIGFKFSQRWRVVFGQRKNIHFIPRIELNYEKSYHLYCGVVILGSFLVVFDIMRLNVISFNLHSNLNISGIGNIGILMSSLGLILWLCECVYAIKNNVKFRPVAIICTIAYLIPALITSGRQSILIMAVSSFVTLFLLFFKMASLQV